jgi:hypothetical protein
MGFWFLRPCRRGRLLILKAEDRLIENLILGPHGIDNKKYNYGPFPISADFNLFHPLAVSVPEADQGGLVKAEDLFCDFVEGLFEHDSRLQWFPIYMDAFGKSTKERDPKEMT